MSREYARIRISIADDEDFEELSPQAQWLYLRVLIPDPTLNYAGVADWRPKRLIGKAACIDLSYIQAAAMELEESRYCLFDLDTEEVLVRSYIRNDEILRNPKMAAAMVKAYRGIASKTLKAGVVSEVQKAKEEHPEYSSWTFAATAEDLSALVMRPGLDSVGYTNVIQVAITDSGTSPDYQSDSVSIPSTYQPHLSTFNTGGYVNQEPHLPEVATGDEPPPEFCDDHPGGTPTKCFACKRRREDATAWRNRRKREAAERAKNCPTCHGTNLIEVSDDKFTKCNHQEAS